MFRVRYEGRERERRANDKRGLGKAAVTEVSREELSAPT
jgi:hypothetical protein